MFNIEKTPTQWRRIEECDVWGSVESVLKLSFDHLSSPCLKKCFAYCALFPKDFCFEKEQLIQLWMAQGFLGSSEAAMDTGNNYFDELLSNSLFQDVGKDECGNILTCKMHDLVHDLALSVSKFGTLTFSGNSSSIRDKVSQIRHLSIVRDGESLLENLIEAAPKLYSLFSEIDVFEKLSKNLTSFRVLKFSAANDDVELPASLGKLKHLRYLDISKTSIKALPRSITKLYMLQTLRFMGCEGLTFPDGLRNLISLRHIHFNQESSQPVELRLLTSLQTLPMFFVGVSEHHIDVLKHLNELGGELRICNLQHVGDKQQASEANLHLKAKLRKVIFEWGPLNHCENGEEVLEGLQPHSSLQSLIVRNYAGESFPSWMLRPVHHSNTGLWLLDNLVELKLIDCNNCNSLPPLGQLHNLEFLTLENMEKVKCMGTEFYCNGTCDGMNELFPALKRFTLIHMTNLEEWTAMAAQAMFPCLEELDISDCPLLECVPLTRQCSSLQKVSICGCLNLSSIGDGLATATLRSLDIYSCTKLEVVPITGRCSSLEMLRISSCEKLSKIGGGLSLSTCLKELHLFCCPNLSSIPDLEGFSSLRSLYIRGCDKLEIIPITGRCSSLEKLDISDCEKLSKVGGGLSTSTCLKELRLSGCPTLSSIPDLEGFSSLRSLHISDCDRVEIVPITGRCSSLEELSIRNCEKLSEIGDGLSTSTCLKELSISFCPNLRSVPGLWKLHSLYNLTIMRCRRLRSIPDDSLGSLTCLRELEIGGFSRELEEFPGLNSIQHLSASLRVLCLIEWEKLKSLPYQLQHLTALEELKIKSFHGIEVLPEWVGNLSSVKRLKIISCDNLKRLPPVDVMQNLSYLKTFEIRRCPQLKTRCAKESGPEWSKISRIPRISIDSIRINYERQSSTDLSVSE